MDNTEGTLSSRLRYALIALVTLTSGAIISHFCTNHTPVVKKVPVIQPSATALYQVIALPPEVPRKIDIVAREPVKEAPVVTKTTLFKSSVIHHNIEAAARAAGLTAPMAHEVFSMFLAAGTARDIHAGDRLNVLYHEYFVNDHKAHPGNVVAAEIIDGKHDYRMVRFSEPNHSPAFYTTNGHDTVPLFLKTPLHYERIGSKFSYHRYDPVLHTIRPHLGVDFDAPLGTPVKAIGDGIVVFCKQMRGYGNVLMIRYGKTYKTLYAHLEKFAAHVRPNTPVKKGQVVGYVGETGWATGPHLHFAIYKNGIAVNPLTIQFPQGSSIPEKYRRDFFYRENRWFSEMKLFEATKK